MTEKQSGLSTAGTKQAIPQWSYTSGTSTTPLLGLTIGDQFDQTVSRYPDNLALVACQQNIRWTYLELQEQVNQCAKGLLHLGIQKGQRVGIWSPNRAEWCVTQFATSKIGAILVNVNPSYRLHEVEYVLNQSGCSAIIIAAAFKTSNYTEMIASLAPELANSTLGQLQSEKLPHLRTVIRMGEDRAPGMLPWSELLAMGNQVSDEQLQTVQHEQAFDYPINIQYTSGTTGFPKGATLSHHNILNNGYFVAELQNITHEDKMCIPVPLYHCFGMVMGNLGCVTHGATMVYPAEGFDPQATLAAV
ncbi:MAG: AMP-binding protein, partial [Ktedonobacteraceae bacterium]|nr:AMP-binding protein [Ktedonobacteraceae bacterium]